MRKITKKIKKLKTKIEKYKTQNQREKYKIIKIPTKKLKPEKM